jgi:WG containing repeat
MKTSIIRIQFLLVLLLLTSKTFGFSPKDSVGTVSNSVKTRKVFTAEQARKVMMMTLAKTTPFYNKDSLLKHFQQFLSTANVLDYKDYVGGMEGQLKKKINILEYDNIRNVFQLEQLNDLRGRFSLLQSATCLTEKKEGNFVRIKDAEGRDMMVTPVQVAGMYSEVQKYKQGFAKVQKGQLYGFLNLCGEEVISCQYTHAEGFNDGKALVKQNDKWKFIDITGKESVIFKNIVDAISLAKGISLVRYKDGKYALIDNHFDKTQTPISDIYDLIEPLPNEDFRVKNGEKTYVIHLDGTQL